MCSWRLGPRLTLIQYCLCCLISLLHATAGHINPDVAIESYTMNITTVSGFDEFKSSVTDPDTGNSRVDLILSCVDNYEARITINQVW